MDIASIDLNLLHVLEALLRERSVTRAAKRLHLTQSATSSALGRLRKVTGDPLLVRTADGMVPTARALAMVEPLTQALHFARMAFADGPRFDPSRSQAHFVLMTTDYVQMVLLPPLLQKLAKDAPGVTLAFRHPIGALPVRELERGDIDMVFAPYDEAPAGFYRQTLFTESMVTVVRRGHPVLARPWRIEEFLAMGHVVVSFTGARTGPLDEALAARGARRHVAVSVPSFPMALALVARCDLVTTMPARLVAAYRDALGLEVLPLPMPPQDFSIHQIWHERTHVDPAHAWFRGVIRELFAPP